MNELATIDSTLNRALQANIENTLAQVAAVREIQKRMLVDKSDYGTIPGCGDKPTLLKPGAEKLLAHFQLSVGNIDIEKDELDGGHVEYRVILAIIDRGQREVVGMGVGSCSTMESKYRYRKGERTCPHCGAASIIKGKAEYGGGWLCYGKKGGCGAKFQDGDLAIEGQQTGRVENPDPADQRNTVLKMAKKRALIDAALTTTAASHIFTQDIEDYARGEDHFAEPVQQFQQAPPMLQDHNEPAAAQPQRQREPKLKPASSEPTWRDIWLLGTAEVYQVSGGEQRGDKAIWYTLTYDGLTAVAVYRNVEKAMQFRGADYRGELRCVIKPVQSKGSGEIWPMITEAEFLNDCPPIEEHTNE